jgi:hypothetical protein|tara:strand:- start:670 stop:876 length:207 start_codon:yes stop_codon:yes gene_type:complete
MKHSTFYKDKFGMQQVYTTIKNTPHHEFLRDDHDGKTYSHEDNATLYFIAPDVMPLGIPIGKNVEQIF